MEQSPAGRRSPLVLLQNVPLFSGLPESQVYQIARMAGVRRVPRNTTIVRVGDSTDALFVLVSGSAKVLNRDAEGREVILSLLGAGECFGEMGLIDGAPRSADVVAVEACELLEISRADFTQALAGNPELCLNIMKSLVMRLRQANWKIESLALMDVFGRVAKCLLELSEDVDGVRLIRSKVTKQDLAKMVGASREMVTRVMKDLEATGYIRIEEGVVVIVGE